MLWELFAAFAKIGLFSFGGGYAVIPLLEREIVDLHGWLSSAQTIDIIALSQMTPGPIAINLATFVGYQTAGILGAVVATLGIVAPSVLFITVGISVFRKAEGGDSLKAVLGGVKPVVIALIASAAFFITTSAGVNIKGIVIAVVVFFLANKNVHPVWLIVFSGLFGIIIY